MCYHAVAEVQKEENMCPCYVWHRRRRLAAGKKERMWRALQAVLPGEEHMLATNRTCGRRGPILVLDRDFGGAAHGMVRWIRKEGVNMEVLHVRRKDMKEYKKAGLHHAGFYRDTRVVEWGVYRWMMRRARGQEDAQGGAGGCARCGTSGRRCGGSNRGSQEAGEERGCSKREWCWTGGRGTRPDQAYCCVRRWD